MESEITTMYDLTIRLVAEVLSAVLSLILVYFMLKPYRLTKEARYLGLPLGFCFLGLSYILGAISLSQLFSSYFSVAWIPLLTRTFAFLFLAVVYYFSKKPSKYTRLMWDMTIGLLIIALAASIAAVLVFPQFAAGSYHFAQQYFRIFDMVCLAYIAFYTLRSHLKNLDPKTIWIPFGFILFAISQYSFLIWNIDASNFAFTGGLLIRLAGLLVFLSVSYRTFYSLKKEEH